MRPVELREANELKLVAEQVISAPDRKLRFQTPQQEDVHGFLKDLNGEEIYL